MFTNVPNLTETDCLFQTNMNTHACTAHACTVVEPINPRSKIRALTTRLHGDMYVEEAKFSV